MATLSELFVVLKADTTDFQQKMSAVNSTLGSVDKTVKNSTANIAKASKEMGLSLLAMSAAVLGPVIAGAKAFADLGKQLVETSAKTGIGVESLSEYKYMAEMTGSSLEAFTNDIKLMQKNLVAAEAGTGTASNALKMLGLNIKDLMMLSPDKQFDTIAAAIASVQDPAQRTALALDIFGRSATDLLPLFAEGAAGMEELKQKAHELGLVMTDETATKAEELYDSLANLKDAAEGLKLAIGEGVAPLIKEFADDLTTAAESVRRFIEQNPELVQMLTKVAAGVAVVGTGLLAIGTIGPKIGLAIGYLKTGLTMLSAATISPELLAAAAAVVLLAKGTQELVDAQDKSIANTGAIVLGCDEYSKAMRGELFDVKKVEDAITALEDQKSKADFQPSLNPWTSLMNAIKYATGANGKFTDSEQKVLDLMKQALPDLENSTKAMTDAGAATEQLEVDWGDLKTSWAEAQTPAGKLGVTLKDLETYLLNTGRQAELTDEVINTFGDDVNGIAGALGINLSDIADAMALTTSKMAGDVSDFTTQAEQQAQELADAQKTAIDDQMTAEGEAHDKRLSQLSDEYDAIMANINAQLGITVGGLQTQIDAINAQQAADDKAYKDKQNQQDVADLKSQIAAETDAKKKADLQKQLADLLAQIDRDNLRDRRQSQIDALQQQIADARTAAQTQLDDAKATYDKQVKQETDAFKAFSDEKTEEKVIIDQQLKDTQANYEADQKAFNTLLSNKLLSMTTYVNAYNQLMAKLSTVAGTAFTPVKAPASITTPTVSATLPTTSIPKFAFGGVVPGPLGAPQLAVVHGGEEFSGVGRSFSSGPAVVINSPNLMNDSAMRQLVRMIQPYLGQSGRRDAFLQVNGGSLYRNAI